MILLGVSLKAQRLSAVSSVLPALTCKTSKHNHSYRESHCANTTHQGHSRMTDDDFLSGLRGRTGYTHHHSNVSRATISAINAIKLSRDQLMHSVVIFRLSQPSNLFAFAQGGPNISAQTIEQLFMLCLAQRVPCFFCFHDAITAPPPQCSLISPNQDYLRQARSFSPQVSSSSATPLDVDHSS